jgi:HPt (histidine-containing phosphotransfer) domain-containing protein
MGDSDLADLQALLPALDVHAGMARVVGSRTTYLDLLEKFRLRFTGFTASLGCLLEAGDQDEAVIQAHSLKGIAASLGAEKLKRAAKSLELQLRQGEDPRPLTEVDQYLKEVLEQIESLDLISCGALSTGGDYPAGDMDTTPWQTLLREMLIPLRKMQVNEVKARLAQLRRHPWSQRHAEEFCRLDKLVSAYQYKQAAAYIEHLL